MNFQLSQNEPVSEGLKRLMIEECRTALSYLNNANSDYQRHLAVHEVRKSFKRIRACLRLVRDRIDYYHQENNWFRGRGQEISAVRNASADLEVLLLFQDPLQKSIGRSLFDDLNRHLMAHREKIADKTFHKDNRLEKLHQVLEIKVKTITDWPLDIQTFSDIKTGIKRTYKRGRKGLKRVKASQNPERLHYLRKRAKYLCHQCGIITRIWPPLLDVIEDELHQVTDLIGTYLDLENVTESIDSLETLRIDHKEKARIATFVKDRQYDLKNQAIFKGRKIYCENTSGFCDRLEVYWDIHKKESEDLPKEK